MKVSFGIGFGGNPTLLQGGDASTFMDLVRMAEGYGAAAIGTYDSAFLGGGVPKDFIQIAATSVSTLRGTGEPSPHVAAIQITTDNAVYGGSAAPAWRASVSRGARSRRTATT